MKRKVATFLAAVLVLAVGFSSYASGLDTIPQAGQGNTAADSEESTVPGEGAGNPDVVFQRLLKDFGEGFLVGLETLFM